MRKLGGIVGKCEHWNPYARKRQDLFGIFDAVALLGRKIIGVQCVNTHLPEHITKIKASQPAHVWYLCGGRIEIHNWKKSGPRGKRKTWKCDVVEVNPWA
jgi:hypothetical protein